MSSFLGFPFPLVSLKDQNFFNGHLEELSHEIQFYKSRSFDSPREVEGVEEALLQDNPDIFSYKEDFWNIQTRILAIAQSAMYPGHTAQNFGNYSLAGRINLLGDRIYSELATSPNEFPPSLRVLDELVSLSMQAIRADTSLPLLEEEIEDLPSLSPPPPPSGLFSCCRRRRQQPPPTMETSDVYGYGSTYLFQLKSIHKQPFGNYSLKIKTITLDRCERERRENIERLITSAFENP